MKAFFNWNLLLGLFLILASAAFYIIHFLVFGDAHHIFIYFLGDLAFLPIEVLLVTLIIHRLLSEREKRAMLKKMNMVIGSFFSEVGTGLIRRLSSFDSSMELVREKVSFINGSKSEFSQAGDFFRQYRSSIDSRSGSLGELRTFLSGKKEFLLRLLENPILLDHETFTDLLWAVFHLTEELDYRQSLSGLSRSDYLHLSEDIRRSYVLLIDQWLKYMRHLKDNYPYLFSLALRVNPFDPGSSAEIK